MGGFPRKSVALRNLINAGVVAFALTFVVSCVFSTGKTPEKATANTAVTNTETQANAVSNRPLKKDDTGDFIVRLSENVEQRYADIDAKIKKDKLLEKAADDLNRTLSLPSDIFIQTAVCNEPNAEFDSEKKSITVCFELVMYFSDLFESAGIKGEALEKKTFDAVRFAFLHEVGHALIENYRLPVTGSEEDAADRCSAYINIVELRQPGVESVIAAADAFRIESRRKPLKNVDSLGEHLLEEQRAHNSLCMIYGNAPEKYRYFVADGYLPAERAGNCPAEYARMVESWENLLRPWRKAD